MKTLILFADMLRNDLIIGDNPNNQLKQFQGFLGGEIFTNMFTHAPDTPRSLACFWSGLIPEKNGCNTRLKYPYFFLKNPTLLSELKEDGVKINVSCNPNKLRSGIIPLSFKELNIVDTTASLEKFCSTIKKETDSSLTFIDLSDIHYANDDFSHTRISERFGISKLCDALTSIFSIFKKSDFDLILFFSDHGHFYDEERRKSNLVDLLDNNRSKIYAQVWSKGCQNQEIDSLYSICDLKSIIQTRLKNNKELPNARTKIIIEDHIDFNVGINQFIGIWRVITDNYSFSIDLNGAFKGCQSHLEEVLNILKTETKTYLDITKQNKVLYHYKNMKRITAKYSNGSKRIQPLKHWLFKKPYQIINFFISKIESI